MSNASIHPRAGLRVVATLAAMLVPSLAFAGECPADQQRADARQPVAYAARGVTDTVLASIDVSQEPARIAERHFRLRRLVIEPGGIVPWHSHGDRPAIIYIVQGEIMEYASNCAVPITHNAGDVAPEKKGVSHWWQNNTSEPVVLISVDILHDKAGVDKKMM